jgi:hypothetical protein
MLYPSEQPPDHFDWAHHRLKPLSPTTLNVRDIRAYTAGAWPSAKGGNLSKLYTFAYKLVLLRSLLFQAGSNRSIDSADFFLTESLHHVSSCSVPSHKTLPVTSVPQPGSLATCLGAFAYRFALRCSLIMSCLGSRRSDEIKSAL